MRYPYRIIVIIASAVVNSSRTALTNVIRKQNAISINLAPLGASEAGPVTHFGSQFPFTNKQKADFDAISSTLNSVFWFLLDNRDGILLSTSTNVVNPPIGTKYSFNQAVAKVGLIRK